MAPGSSYPVARERHVVSTCQGCPTSGNPARGRLVALHAVSHEPSRWRDQNLMAPREAKKRRERMQPSRQRFIAAMVLTAVGLLSAPVVNAQTQPPAAAPSGQTTNIPEQKLDAAAAAME